MSVPTSKLEEQKRDAANRAVEFLEPGMVVGLGTGSTADYATEAIARELKSGRLFDILGIATSRRTQELAEALQVPLSTLDDHSHVDLTIDGADEVSPAGDLVKGGGGALLREKIVASVTNRYVIIVDETKLVERLGVSFPLPVEVVSFGWSTLVAPIRELGAEPVLRRDSTGAPYRTPAGNFILDCWFEGGIQDPATAHHALKMRPGVVETGLFLDLNPEVLVGRAPGWRG